MAATTEQSPVAEYESAREESRAFVEHLASAQSLPALTRAFEVEMPEDYARYDTTQKLGWFKGFANEHLDIRKGKERQNADKVTYTPEQEMAIAAFTHEFGMEGETNASQK